jgi:hypothetical protein
VTPLQVNFLAPPSMQANDAKPDEGRSGTRRYGAGSSCLGRVQFDSKPDSGAPSARAGSTRPPRAPGLAGYIIALHSGARWVFPTW